MQRSVWIRCRASVATVALVAAGALALGASSTLAEGDKPFSVSGTYIEGCNCSIVCTCVLTGFMKGCEGVGAMALTSGSFNGEDLAGVKIAAGIGLGSWVRVYVDAKDAKQSAAAGEFARTAFAPYGKVEAVTDAKIDISGADGKYTLSVDGGKVMALTTEPVLGLDKKSAVAYTNFPDPLNPTIYQGKTVSGSFKDGAHSFKLAASNAFFNPTMKSEGKL